MRLHLHRGAALWLIAVLVGLAAPLGIAGVETPSPTQATFDVYQTDEDTPLSIPAPGVLANDPPGACVAGTETSTLIGSLTMQPDGSFNYTPPTNYHGDTSFGYGLAAGVCPTDTWTDAATVTITVASVNDAPTATADSFTVLKDRTLNIGVPGVLLNDHDVDGDPLTAVPGTGAAHGVVTLAANGSFSYTPASGYTGPDAFSYKASDGTEFSPTRVVSLTVTAVPPVPTRTPIPTPTAAPTATPEITAEPSPSEEPSPSVEPSPSAEATPSPSAAPSATPSPTAAPGPAAEGGGIPLPVLLVLVLFVLFVGFGAALYGPRWLAAQRGETIDDDAGS